MNSYFHIDPESQRICMHDGRATQVKAICRDKATVLMVEQLADKEALMDCIRRRPSLFQCPPVGVIGPRQASNTQYAIAESLGSAFAERGLTVICGGHSGVMEAVCKGVNRQGGRSIGILPGERWEEANPYVSVPVVTGMGSMRNSIIAHSAFALVAVGGGYGTLTEMAYGLHYHKPVFAIAGAPLIEGIEYVDSIDGIIKRVSELFLGVTKV
jgi:uncharacterized protein (TIGR00725 family)